MRIFSLFSVISSKNTFFISPGFSGDRVYYGVSDRNVEGTWICDGTGQVLATATGPGTAGPLFHSSQPDNQRGSQHCASGRRHHDFLIGDVSCTDIYHYVCEKPSM